MSDPNRIIRDARLAERNRRNNSWHHPAYLAPKRTDAEILAADTKARLCRSPDGTETPKERIQRRLSAS